MIEPAAHRPSPPVASVTSQEGGRGALHSSRTNSSSDARRPVLPTDDARRWRPRRFECVSRRDLDTGVVGRSTITLIQEASPVATACLRRLTARFAPTVILAVCRGAAARGVIIVQETRQCAVALIDGVGRTDAARLPCRSTVRVARQCKVAERSGHALLCVSTARLARGPAPDALACRSARRYSVRTADPRGVAAYDLRRVAGRVSARVHVAVKALIDVNYFCRSATTILAGSRQIPVLVSSGRSSRASSLGSS